MLKSLFTNLKLVDALVKPYTRASPSPSHGADGRDERGNCGAPKATLLPYQESEKLNPLRSSSFS